MQVNDCYNCLMEHALLQTLHVHMQRGSAQQLSIFCSKAVSLRLHSPLILLQLSLQTPLQGAGPAGRVNKGCLGT